MPKNKFKIKFNDDGTIKVITNGNCGDFLKVMRALQKNGGNPEIIRNDDGTIGGLCG